MPAAPGPCGRTCSALKRSTWASEVMKHSQSASPAMPTPTTWSSGLSDTIAWLVLSGRVLRSTRLMTPERMPRAIVGAAEPRGNSPRTRSLPGKSRKETRLTPSFGVGFAGSSAVKSPGSIRSRSPDEVTTPRGLRVLERNWLSSASWLRRFAGGGNSVPSILEARPEVVSTTTQSVSWRSSETGFFVVACGTGVLSWSRISVRLGVGKRSFISASSWDTSCRIFSGAESSSSREAMSSRNWSRSVSNSIRENLVSRRRRSSKM